MSEHGARTMEVALVKAVRSLAINRHSRLGENGRLIPNGGSCDLCNGEWEEVQPEDHAPDCLARPNLVAALAAAGDRTAVPHDQREPESTNETMREALRVIRDMTACEEGETAAERELIVEACRDVARTALAVSPGKGEEWREIETARILHDFIERQSKKLRGMEGSIAWRNGYGAAMDNMSRVLAALPSPPISSRAEDS